MGHGFPRLSCSFQKVLLAKAAGTRIEKAELFTKMRVPKTAKMAVFCNFFKVLPTPRRGVRGEEGAAFFRMKSEKISAFRYANRQNRPGREQR